MYDVTARVRAMLKAVIRKKFNGMLSVMMLNRSISIMCRKYIRQENRDISLWNG